MCPTYVPYLSYVTRRLEACSLSREEGNENHNTVGESGWDKRSGGYQRFASWDGSAVRQKYFSRKPETLAVVLIIHSACLLISGPVNKKHKINKKISNVLSHLRVSTVANCFYNLLIALSNFRKKSQLFFWFQRLKREYFLLSLLLYDYMYLSIFGSWHNIHFNIMTVFLLSFISGKCWCWLSGPTLIPHECWITSPGFCSASWTLTCTDWLLS